MTNDRSRPDLDDTTVEGLGKLSEALETVDQARGLLYGFHQLTGKADLLLQDAVELLRTAGHDALADDLDRDLVGRNVIADRWTFQIVEDYDANYWSTLPRLRRARPDRAGRRRPPRLRGADEAARAHEGPPPPRGRPRAGGLTRPMIRTRTSGDPAHAATVQGVHGRGSGPAAATRSGNAAVAGGAARRRHWRRDHARSTPGRQRRRTAPRRPALQLAVHHLRPADRAQPHAARRLRPAAGPPASGPPASAPAARHTGRTIGRTLAAALLVFVTVLLVLFVMFNTQTVDISLVFTDIEAPLVLALLVAAVLGALVVSLAGLLRRARAPLIGPSHPALGVSRARNLLRHYSPVISLLLASRNSPPDRTEHGSPDR